MHACLWYACMCLSSCVSRCSCAFKCLWRLEANLETSRDMPWFLKKSLTSSRRFNYAGQPINPRNLSFSAHHFLCVVKIQPRYICLCSIRFSAEVFLQPSWLCFTDVRYPHLTCSNPTSFIIKQKYKIIIEWQHYVNYVGTEYCVYQGKL